MLKLKEHIYNFAISPKEAFIEVLIKIIKKF